MATDNKPLLPDSEHAWSTLQSWKLTEEQRGRTAPSLTCTSSASQSSNNAKYPDNSAPPRTDLWLTFARERAAVLVCLFQSEEGEVRVILTRRTKALSSHSGQVALPGGKRDKEDADDVATALREAKEEIGLDPSLVKVLTILEPFVSENRLRVTPVVAVLSERSKFKPLLNVAEVDAIFDAPLNMFLMDKHHIEEVKWLGFTYEVHYFDIESSGQKFVVYAMTAAVLIRCASVVYQQPPIFSKLHPYLPGPRL